MGSSVRPADTPQHNAGTVWSVLAPPLVPTLESVPIAESGKLRKLAGEVTCTLAALLSRTVKYVASLTGLTR